MASPPSHPDPSFPELELRDRARAFNDLVDERDWSAIAPLFHPEARLESVASGGVHGPAETIAALRAASEDGIFSRGPLTVEELAPDAVIVRARLRHRARRRGGISDVTYYWLFTGREGLIWRIKVFTSRSQAARYLARHGLDLGLEPAVRPGDR